MQKIRLAHVVFGIVSGGVEQMLINYFSGSDFKNFELFIIYNGEADPSCLSKLEKCGFKPIKVKYNPGKHKIKHLIELYKIMKENKIEIAHLHTNQENYLGLVAAYMAKVKVRISHSHGDTPATTSWFKKFIVRKMKRLIGIKFSNCKLACSSKVGKNLFENKNFDVIYNAIEIDKFKFDKEKRDLLREELNIKNNKVIGYIGRFNKEKNHMFLIKAFSLVVKEVPDALLMLIGTGSLEDDLRAEISNLGIEDKVIFISPKENIYDYYQVMDLFVFPSFAEGLGMVAIESQINGLPCIASTGLPSETNISNYIKYLDLDLGADLWALEIVKDLKIRNEVIDIKCDNFDVNKQRKVLKNIYEVLYENKKID